MYKLILIVIACALVYRFKGNYSQANLYSTLPPAENRDIEIVSPLLNQPFYFLGSGGTCFAFLGEDGKTVLKLFKHQHLFRPQWLFSFFLPGVTDRMRIERCVYQERKQHHKRLPFFFASCQIAYTRLRQETGLLFLTLRPDRRFSIPVLLIDGLGIKQVIDLSRTEFALQERATPLFDHLDALIAQEQLEEAKSSLDSLVALICTRCERGVDDRDPNLPFNFGFVDGRAVEWDIGSFSLEPKTGHAVKKELFFATFALREWLAHRSPPLLEYLLFKIRERSATVFLNE